MFSHLFNKVGALEERVLLNLIGSYAGFDESERKVIYTRPGTWKRSTKLEFFLRKDGSMGRIWIIYTGYDFGNNNPWEISRSILTKFHWSVLYKQYETPEWIANLREQIFQNEKRLQLSDGTLLPMTKLYEALYDIEQLIRTKPEVLDFKLRPKKNWGY